MLPNIDPIKTSSCALVEYTLGPIKWLTQVDRFDFLKDTEA